MELSESDLKKQIRSGEFLPVYFLYGEEPYLISYYASAIKKKIVPSDCEMFQFQKFGEKATANEVAEAAEALPLFGSKKCVLVANLNAETISPAELKAWETFLKDPPESCVIVFSLMSQELNPKKMSAKWRTFLKNTQQKGGAVYFGKRSLTALTKLLCEKAKQFQADLQPECAAYMVRQCGDDLNHLLQELEKVCAFADGNKITTQMIDQVTVKTPETASYRLANALLAGKFDEAYQLLDILFYQREDPVVVLASLSSAYIDLYRARCVVSSGKDISTAAKDFDYRAMEFKLRNAVRDVKKFSDMQLIKSLDALYQADIALKSTRMAPRTVLEKLLASLLWIYTQKG